MPRLRTVSPSQPGYVRKRQGRGFVYLDGCERVTDPDEIARIRSLVIPPAWQDVWICRFPNGHIQAVGTDAAGRRQYLYHPVWRQKRDAEKFERMLEFGAALTRARQLVVADPEPTQVDQPNRDRGRPLEGQRLELDVLRHRRAQLREMLAEADQLVVLGLLLARAEVGVVEVLPPAGLVDAGRLELRSGTRGDPDVAPGRRNRQRGNPGEGILVRDPPPA